MGIAQLCNNDKLNNSKIAEIMSRPILYIDTMHYDGVIST